MVIEIKTKTKTKTKQNKKYPNTHTDTHTQNPEQSHVCKIVNSQERYRYDKGFYLKIQ